MNTISPASTTVAKKAAVVKQPVETEKDSVETTVDKAGASTNTGKVTYDANHRLSGVLAKINYCQNSKHEELTIKLGDDKEVSVDQKDIENAFQALEDLISKNTNEDFMNELKTVFKDGAWDEHFNEENPQTLTKAVDNMFKDGKKVLTAENILEEILSKISKKEVAALKHAYDLTLKPVAEMNIGLGLKLDSSNDRNNVLQILLEQAGDKKKLDQPTTEHVYYMRKALLNTFIHMAHQKTKKNQAIVGAGFNYASAFKDNLNEIINSFKITDKEDSEEKLKQLKGFIDNEIKYKPELAKFFVTEDENKLDQILADTQNYFEKNGLQIYQSDVKEMQQYLKVKEKSPVTQEKQENMISNLLKEHGDKILPVAGTVGLGLVMTILTKTPILNKITGPMVQFFGQIPGMNQIVNLIPQLFMFGMMSDKVKGNAQQEPPAAANYSYEQAQQELTKLEQEAQAQAKAQKAA